MNLLGKTTLGQLDETMQDLLGGGSIFNNDLEHVLALIDAKLISFYIESEDDYVDVFFNCNTAYEEYGTVDEHSLRAFEIDVYQVYSPMYL